MINERLNRLKTAMLKHNIDVYYFNTSDYHMSEYVADYFKTLAYFSGFTGSMATLLVTLKDTYIFVDGRYHVQADRQCLPHGLKVVKLGTKNGMEPMAFLKKYFASKTIGLDGRRTNVKFAKELLKNNLKIRNVDIYSALIEERTPLGKDPIYELSTRYTGISRKTKLEMVKHVLQGKTHIINNLESIAYILNLRGNDIAYTPVFYSYLVFHGNNVYLFMDSYRIDKSLMERILDDGVIVRPYDSYYKFLYNIAGSTIIIDENKVNYESFVHINRNGNLIYDKRSPIEDMKAIKNEIEQKNMRLAHIYDGVAMLRFWMWLEKIDKRTISEYDAASKLDTLRRIYKAKDISFASIVAHDANAAMMHYFPEKGRSTRLKNRGILLFDSGGQYPQGTTDVTRTVALGNVSPEVKKYFTLVLKSMFNLSEVRFLKGLNGNQLDILARKDLWEIGVDYRCGTGHGVGFNLAVHESPPNIRYGHTDNGSELAEIKPGMVFSDEPGVYFEGKFGIRCENLLLCVNDASNEYGQFLRFEHLTMVPFDLELIDKDYLDEKTIAALNRYHSKVYKTLLPYLDDEEAQFLKEKTRLI